MNSIYQQNIALHLHLTQQETNAAMKYIQSRITNKWAQERMFLGNLCKEWYYFNLKYNS